MGFAEAPDTVIYRGGKMKTKPPAIRHPFPASATLEPFQPLSILPTFYFPTKKGEGKIFGLFLFSECHVGY